MFDIAPLTLTPGRHAVAALQLMATLRADNKDRLAGYANIDPLGTQILYGDSIELDYKHLIAIGQQDTKLRLMTVMAQPSMRQVRVLVKSLVGRWPPLRHICAPLKPPDSRRKMPCPASP